MSKPSNTQHAKTSKAQEAKPSVGTQPAVRARANPRVAKIKPEPAVGAVARTNTKLAAVVALLRGKQGATLDQMMKATAWQRHSVRGAISGSVKKKLGLNVVSEKKDGGERRYRIEG